MDAFAVTISNMFAYRNLSRTRMMLMPITFGFFQGIMPLIGYFAGTFFADMMSRYAGIISFLILGFIGGKMIWDGFHHDEACPVKPFGPGLLLMQAVATSIDALAVGVSFAAVSANIYLAVSLIGATTFVLSLIAVRIGQWIGDKLNAKAEIFGGTILVLIGLKIFIEHMWLG